MVNLNYIISPQFYLVSMKLQIFIANFIEHKYYEKSFQASTSIWEKVYMRFIGIQFYLVS